jgi:hypothetical protein
VKTNTPGGTADLAAEILLAHQRVHRSVAARIWELSDGGLDVHEIASTTGYPPYLIRVVLRGGADRPVPPGCAKPRERERD